MELRQLQYVVAAADAGNITRAAHNVCIAQPAVSAQIRQLERELGEPLFHRDRRGVRLTTAGEAFLPHARAALDAVARGRADIAALHGLVEGRLRVGVSGPVDDCFAAALGSFVAAHPGIDMTLREHDPHHICDLVAEGELDVAEISLTGEPVPSSVRTRVVATDPLVVAVPRGHRFASWGQVAFADLEAEPLISTGPSTGLRQGLERGCAAAGFHPTVVAETTGIRSLLGLTAAGVGIALVPRSLADDPRVVLIEIVGPSLERPVAIAWNEAASSPAVRAFLDLVIGRFDTAEPSAAPRPAPAGPAPGRADRPAPQERAAR